jgi:fused signal recognition particle receptor
MSIFGKLKSALSKTSNAITSLGGILSKRSPTKQEIEDFEEVLLLVDFGITTTDKILSSIKNKKIEKEQETFKDLLEKEILNIFAKSSSKFSLSSGLNIIIMCGVNGNGKTTTIGKLSNKFNKMGKKVVIAACDTFRSAAAEQISIWAERTYAKIITGPENSDPASVAFKAVNYAIEIGADVLLVDTAGRLQNKQNLMDELSKIISVIKKTGQSNIKTILTLDASTGQNAFSQAEKFKEHANIDGIIFTKLDGSAKGGVIVGVVDKFEIPVYYFTTGESLEDIEEFDSAKFASALLN